LEPTVTDVDAAKFDAFVSLTYELDADRSRPPALIVTPLSTLPVLLEAVSAARRSR
jgi:hypothetical protein